MQTKHNNLLFIELYVNNSNTNWRNSTQSKRRISVLAAQTGSKAGVGGGGVFTLKMIDYSPPPPKKKKKKKKKKRKGVFFNPKHEVAFSVQGQDQGHFSSQGLWNLG